MAGIRLPNNKGCRLLRFLKQLVSSGILILFLQFCTGESHDSNMATLLVRIVDNNQEETPIPDVEVIITPGNLIKKTDLKGECRFDLKPGDYFVAAEVCCIGPGNIRYYNSVNLSASETKTLKFYGCLACL
jgi:hypothetical protein